LSLGTNVVFSHNNIIYKDKFNLSLSTTKSGYDIYYTKDGSDPLQGGLLYQIPIEISESTTIKAVAKLLDYTSPVVEKKYMVNGLKTPTISMDKMDISAGNYHTIGLKRDGTVVAVGNNNYGQLNVSGWKDIVSISAGNNHTVGLKRDGTVVAVGNENYYGQLNVSNWKDIVSISAGDNYTIGLKKDGTVEAVGVNGEGQIDVSNWKDIVAISAGVISTVGLKSDGTVVGVGYNGCGQLNVSNWNDVVAISAEANYTVGLKADGTVVAVGENSYGQLNVSTWKDIVAISAKGSVTIGLKRDGTVVAVGSDNYGQLNVTNWQDIVSISRGSNYTVGLKADGTVVAIGYNGYGQLNVTNWNLNTTPTVWDSSYKMVYENPANVSLTTRAGYDIYYTKDGSTPTKFSLLYQNPIILENTVTLKAIAYKEGVYGSVYEAPYIINDKTIPTTSGTNISGSISQNTIWKRSNSPYKINGNTLISTAASLYIEPGVEILFAKDVALQVQGSIYCLGMADNKITIKGQTADKWAYLQINNQTANNKTYIDNTEISNANKSIYAIKGENIVVKNSVVENCSTGIESLLSNLILDSSKLENNVIGYIGGGNIVNSVISNNTNKGISNTNSYNLTITNSIIDKNGYSGISGNFTADNCIVSNNDYGISSEYCDFTIKNSKIISNSRGINNNYYNCTIENCIIENNLYYAVYLVGSSYLTKQIKGCTIANNGGYGIIVQSSNAVVNYNNIYNNTLGNVNANSGNSSANLNFKNNYWGTTDNSEIGSKINDFFDYYNYPIVNFEPYLSSGKMTIFIETLNNQNDEIVSTTNLFSLTKLKISAFSKINTKSNLYIAYYDLDNKLISTQINEVDFISSTNNYEIALNTPVPTNTKKVKLFIWDKEFKPVSESYAIN
jgi:alpha-tubulin suppressor-like RCC1 family protein